jgi:prepilin-type processing-associated H-X9-DG protein
MISAAILFPVFAQAREKARQTVCSSNEKQMALAILMYSQDYDEKFPPAPRWMDVTASYVKDDKVYHCPNVGHEPGVYGYAFNTTLSMVQFEKVQEPKTQRMLIDSTNLARNASDTGVSLPSPGRHSRGSVMAYADGRVLWKRSATEDAMPR